MLTLHLIILEKFKRIYNKRILHEKINSSLNIPPGTDSLEIAIFLVN